MCKHKFVQGSKNEIAFCIKCGILSYKSIPSLSVVSLTNTSISYDPLLLKFKSSKFSIDFSNNYILSYLSIRKNAVNFINKQSLFFQIPKNLVYKAINYLDLIYINNTISFDLMPKISITCLLLAIQFNTCCTINSNIDLKNFNTYIKNIKNITEIEILCLKWLDYNLGMYDSYDYIDLFFSIGFIFPSNQICIDISTLYYKCINCLDIIFNDKFFLYFTSYTMALSLIKIVCQYHNCFDNEIFKKIYSINFQKEKYIKCEQYILGILSNHFSFSLYKNLKVFTDNLANNYDETVNKIVKTNIYNSVISI